MFQAKGVSSITRLWLRGREREQYIIIIIIMNISWKDKITNIEVLKRAGLPLMEDMLIQMNLSWLGHVERMDHQRLPRQLLYSQLCEGKCNQGRPRLRFKDTVKRNLEKLDIDRSSWQQKAKDRAMWRNLIRPK